MPSIVIFYHPGGEHKVTPAQLKAGIMPWNNQPFHRRKFLETEGDCIINGNGPQTEHLRFWGEWEPDSYVRKLKNSVSPKFIHTPFLRNPLPLMRKYTGNSCNAKAKSNILQNTDPFVFADSFYYCVCQQVTAAGNLSSMAKLSNGSIILFGSCINGGFALDTVFIVGSQKCYTPESMANDLQGFVPSVYPQIMQLTGSQNLVCYKGATYNAPIEQMYSFVPCRISNVANNVFDRPVLTPADFQSCNMDHILSIDQKQGRKITEVTQQQAKYVWDCVRLAILQQNYIEGFNFRYK